MKCISCHALNIKDATFCDQCGERLSAPKQIEQKALKRKLKPEAESMPDVMVFRTGSYYEAVMVEDELKRSKVPCYMRREFTGGLELAMLFSVSQWPGLYYTIKVPGRIEEKAKEVLASLPVSKTNNPGINDFNPSQKSFWTFYNRLTLTLFCACVVLMFSWWVRRFTGEHQASYKLTVRPNQSLQPTLPRESHDSK